MNENKEVIEDDDIIMPDEVEDTPIENESGEVSEGEQTSNPDENPQEDEDKKFLDYLNKKGIKYNGQNVTLDKMDDVITNIQKGMNYDKAISKEAKNDAEQNAVMSYISEMASKMGLTPTQYIDQVKAYQKQKEQEAVEAEVQRMVTNGVDEQTARDVASVKALADQLKAERAELQKQKEESERKAREDKEYEDFINEFPDIDYSKIPDEVFKEAKEIGLSNAYSKYENKILREKIKTMEQNAKNASNSVVVPTSEGSPTEPESKDAFLEGFDSVI